MSRWAFQPSPQFAITNNVLYEFNESASWASKASWPMGNLAYQNTHNDGTTDVYGHPSAPFYVIPFTSSPPDLSLLSELEVAGQMPRQEPNSLDNLYPPFLETHFPQGTWISTPLRWNDHIQFFGELHLSAIVECKGKCDGSEQVNLTARSFKYADSYNPYGRGGVRITTDFVLTQFISKIEYTWINLVADMGSYASMLWAIKAFFFPTVIFVPMYFKWGSHQSRYESLLSAETPSTTALEMTTRVNPSFADCSWC